MGDGKESLNKMVYELSYYEAWAKSLQQQVELLQASLEETVAAQSAIRGLQKSAGQEALFSLGGRVFVKARPEKKSTVLVESGAGVMVERQFGEALTGLDLIIGKIKAGLEGAQNQLGEISRRAQELNRAVEELSARESAGARGREKKVS